MLTVVGQLPAQRPGFVPYLPRAIGALTRGVVPLLQGGGNSAEGDSGSGFIAHTATQSTNQQADSRQCTYTLLVSKPVGI
eukprot:COSAG06_NODE_34446_length_474_cov_0.994667_1_plen_79_part_10